MYLIGIVRPIYSNTKVAEITIDNVLYALDSTTTSTSIVMAAWKLGKYSKGAVNIHILLDLHKVFLQISILQMRVLFEYKNEFAENITDTSNLTRQNLGNLYKQKILTAHIQAVRISCGAPERTRTFTS